MVYAVYDQEYLKTDLINSPKLYAKGLKENYLSWGKYFSGMGEAVLHGMVVYMIASIYFDNAISEQGYTNDLRSEGNLCYASVILAVTLKILFDSNTINVLVILGALLSFLTYFLFVYVMGLFIALDIYKQIEEFAPFKQVYFVMFIIGFAAMPFKKFYNSLANLVFIEDESDEELREPS